MRQKDESSKKANRFYVKLLLQQPAIATVLEIAIDWTAKHQCFTRTDGEGNKILLLKLEIFFKRALKALFKDIPACYLPSLDDNDRPVKTINGPMKDDKTTSDDDVDEYSINN